MSTPYIAAGAFFDGPYRYELWRHWRLGLPGCTFIMLNPSAADGATDDPTIRRCVGFARSLGCGALRVVNLYAYQATKPAEMLAVPERVGPQNDDHIEAAAREAAVFGGYLIAAWGTKAEPWRVSQVTTMLDMYRLTALGVTKDGHPRHPLYVRADTRPEPWVWKGTAR